MTVAHVVQGFPGLPALPALSEVEGSDVEGSLSKAALLASAPLAALTASAKATASPPKLRAKAEGLHDTQLNDRALPELVPNFLPEQVPQLRRALGVLAPLGGISDDSPGGLVHAL